VEPTLVQTGQLLTYIVAPLHAYDHGMPRELITQKLAEGKTAAPTSSGLGRQPMGIMMLTFKGIQFNRSLAPAIYRGAR
jgi:hypothetical protein